MATESANSYAKEKKHGTAVEANQIPFLGCGSFLLGEFIVASVVRQIDSTGFDNGNDAERPAAKQGHQNGPYEVIIGFRRHSGNMLLDGNLPRDCPFVKT